MRPRRALLFCPGTDRRKITKAAGLDVDSVIIDLEDAAAQNQKQLARDITAQALEELDFGGSERLIRINPVGSRLEFDDLHLIDRPKRVPNGIVLPKVQSADDVFYIDRLLSDVEVKLGLERGRIRLLAIIESALGVVNLKSIAASSERLSALIFGAEDLTSDMGARRTATGHEVAFARSLVVVHAAAYALQSIDTPYVRLKDPDGLVAEARTAVELGFTGKLAIHPAQIAPIAAAFTPTPDETAAARRLIAEHERQQAAGHGVFELDGKMVDMPMVKRARRILGC